jgi:ribosomal protein S18 acetylase RimI-like enzyme
VKWLRANGADSVEVYVARANDSAQKFWRRVGAREYLDRMTIDLPDHLK